MNRYRLSSMEGSGDERMAQLFDCSADNIRLPLKNIYEIGELTLEATTENFSVVQTEGERQVNRNLKFYNLAAIINVGYLNLN